MTIVASVKVRDGLVLATDSMTQIHGRDPNGQTVVLKSYGNATKLFPIGEAPIGVMSYGLGNIGERSIQGLMLEFQPSDTSTVETVAKELCTYLKTAYDAQFSSIAVPQRPGLGVFIAGYARGGQFAEEWEFRFPAQSAPKEVRVKTMFGASWRGIELPFTRLYKGYDPRIFGELKKGGIDDAVIAKLQAILQPLSSAVVYDGMPVQDAVNFAVYILRTTIGLASFEIGPQTCGGPLQVATISSTGVFHWVSRPMLSVASE